MAAGQSNENKWADLNYFCRENRIRYRTRKDKIIAQTMNHVKYTTEIFMEESKYIMRNIAKYYGIAESV
jgi:hypothetical protein